MNAEKFPHRWKWDLRIQKSFPENGNKTDTNVHNDKSGLAETDIHKTLNVKGLYGKSE